MHFVKDVKYLSEYQLLLALFNDFGPTVAKRPEHNPRS
jgi:hypothetical protein